MMLFTSLYGRMLLNWEEILERNTAMIKRQATDLFLLFFF